MREARPAADRRTARHFIRGAELQIDDSGSGSQPALSRQLPPKDTWGC